MDDCQYDWLNRWGMRRELWRRLQLLTTDKGYVLPKRLGEFHYGTNLGPCIKRRSLTFIAQQPLIRILMPKQHRTSTAQRHHDYSSSETQVPEHFDPCLLDTECIAFAEFCCVVIVRDMFEIE